MGKQNNLKKKQKRGGTKDYSRKVDIRDDKDTFLIVCEGEVTEPLYFNAFKVASADIKCIGIGFNTISLVKETMKMMSEREYDQVWCVFDKDSFSSQNFNNAISLAESQQINVAYSNEAFELWFLLHYSFIQTALPRTQYKSMLSSALGRPYSKEDPNMYRDLLVHQEIGIRNAKKLLTLHNINNPATCNPISLVFKLVEELNKFK
ncbi:RloB family protein [Bacillus altitudinis]|uniref:RloB family protein n=1 Tax=Bacillus altitudinis TaxID=293387 RepID=UPI001B821090|nr:RloB family protein [Bacillus altitudinis]MBR0581315.1 RloB domain-containing protein [Bacillus altitudinis A23-8]